MMRLMNMLMLSCKKVTELIEKRTVEEKLSLKNRMQLKMHTSMCDACKSYAGQSKFIEQGFEAHFEEKNIPEEQLSEDIKVKIISTLNNI